MPGGPEVAHGAAGWLFFGVSMTTPLGCPNRPSMGHFFDLGLGVSKNGFRFHKPKRKKLYKTNSSGYVSGK